MKTRIEEILEEIAGLVTDIADMESQLERHPVRNKWWNQCNYNLKMARAYRHALEMERAALAKIEAAELRAKAEHDRKLASEEVAKLHAADMERQLHCAKMKQDRLTSVYYEHSKDYELLKSYLKQQFGKDWVYGQLMKAGCWRGAIEAKKHSSQIVELARSLNIQVIDY